MCPGLKCVECGSYNTVRDKGPLVRQPGGQQEAMTITPPLSPAPAPAPAPSSTQIAASFTMTPEPSPLRLEARLERGANMGAVARRISFSGDTEEDMADQMQSDQL